MSGDVNVLSTLGVNEALNKNWNERQRYYFLRTDPKPGLHNRKDIVADRAVQNL